MDENNISSEIISVRELLQNKETLQYQIIKDLISGRQKMLIS